MKCPHCSGEDNYDNSSINHKYKHKDCNKYFKVCPTCNTFYSESIEQNVNNNQHQIKVDNLFDVDYCRVCKMSWIPDFPTSWTRSITNISWMYELLTDLSSIAEESITAENLFKIQSSNNGVIFNPLRARARGIEEYINGAGKRRMGEYLSYFINGQIIKKDIIDDSIIRGFTKFGEEFISSKNKVEMIAYFISSFSNMKLNNGYQRPQKNSVYKYFKIRFLENLLEIANYNKIRGKLTSKYDFGLSLLARDKDQFESYVLYYLDNFDDEGLKVLFFNENNLELQRAVIGTFINVFISLGLILESDTKYQITNLGINILNYLKDRPGLWYEEILEIAKNEDDTIELISEILVWRLFKNNILNEDDTTLRFQDLEIKLSNKFSLNFSEYEDIHYNLYYDEPMFKKEVIRSTQILDEMLQIIGNDDISFEEIKEYCESLPILWHRGIYDIVNIHEETVLNLVDNFKDDTFRLSLQSGQRWHEKTRQLIKDSGLNCGDYKDNPVFSSIIIDKLNINLPGGTSYNPDMLIYEKGFGTKDCILVDAKDQNSINSEVHKLIGYNRYASDSRVDSYCIISLRGTLPQTTKTRIMDNVAEFNRITIIEEKALEIISEMNCNTDGIIDLIIPQDGFKHLNPKNIREYFENI